MSVLNEAKLNLKNSLNRLEKAIDVKIKQLAQEREQNQQDRDELVELREISSSGGINYENATPENAAMLEQLASEIKKLNNEISDKIDEIGYLREQNSEFSAKLGAEAEKSSNIQNILDDTNTKVDFMITEIRQHLSNRN